MCFTYTVKEFIFAKLIGIHLLLGLFPLVVFGLFVSCVLFAPHRTGSLQITEIIQLGQC